MPMPFLARGQDALALLHDEQLLDFVHHALGIGRGQVDLVDHRDDREVVLQRQVIVRQRLRFDALGGVDDQQRAFARGERARNFVREIDVAGRIDQIELEDLAVLPTGSSCVTGCILIVMPALALEVHGVEHLLAHGAHGRPFS